MRVKSPSSIVLAIMCIGASVFPILNASGDEIQKAAAIILVPTDYKTIREAVTNAQDGADIFIGPGTYNEQISIRKQLRLIGCKASDVIVGGTQQFAGVYIRWDGVTIENLTSVSILDPLASKRTVVRNCILKHPIAFLGRDCILDKCIVIIPPQPPLVEPLGSPAGGPNVSMDRGYGCILSNNLLLESRTRGAGHFEGQPPPVVTPTPTIPCTGFGCPPGPAPGFASLGGGIFAAGDAQVINNTIVNVHGGDTGYLTLDELADWNYLYPGNADGIRVAACYGIRVANNIVWNVNGGEPLFPNYDGTLGIPASSFGIFVASFASDEHLTLENNLLFDVDYGIAVEVRGSTSGLVLRNNLWASPCFINPSSGDYRLLPNSPAIDAGTPITGIAEDLDGNPRPTNFGWDIGAFEYQNLLSDFNNDGKVDSLDLNEFVRQWGMELPKIKPSGKILIEPIDLTNTNPVPNYRLPRLDHPTPNPELLPVDPKGF